MQSHYELRKIGRKKKNQNQEIKTTKERGWIILRWSCFSHGGYSIATKSFVATKHEIEKKRERNRNSFTPSCYTQATTWPLTPNLILDEEIKHVRIYMCSLFFNYTFCIYVGNQHLPANFGRNPTKWREKQWLQVDPLLWMMIVLNGCKLTTDIWRDCAY